MTRHKFHLYVDVEGDVKESTLRRFVLECVTDELDMLQPEDYMHNRIKGLGIRSQITNASTIHHCKPGWTEEVIEP